MTLLFTNLINLPLDQFILSTSAVFISALVIVQMTFNLFEQ